MKKLPFYKRLILLREYWILINRYRDEITARNNGLNLRIDSINRIFSVINCPEDVRKYGESLSQKYINEYVIKVDKLVVDLNMHEYIGVSEITQLSEVDYLIVFGFAGMDVPKLIKRSIITLSSLIIGISFYFIFF